MRYHFRILNLYIYTGAVLFNSTHHTLLCVECGCSVNHRDVHVHFLVHHSIPSIFRSQMRRQYASRDSHPGNSRLTYSLCPQSCQGQNKVPLKCLQVLPHRLVCFSMTYFDTNVKRIAKGSVRHVLIFARGTQRRY